MRSRLFALALALAATAPLASQQPTANAIVASDGSGMHKTVQEAIDAVPQNTSASNRWTIFIKAGTYRGRVYVQREKRFVTLVGEDASRTVITYNLNATMPGEDGRPIGTFRTPTVTIDADDFTAENLTFENSAGPVGQALALRVDGDRVVFRRSRFLGWQDTIFLNRGRQYFEDCYVAGHVDFIFGGATAYFERCHLHSLRNGYITAASTPPEQRHGFVFVNGRITGEPDVRTYLGRPWRDFGACRVHQHDDVGGGAPRRLAQLGSPRAREDGAIRRVRQHGIWCGCLVGGCPGHEPSRPPTRRACRRPRCSAAPTGGIQYRSDTPSPPRGRTNRERTAQPRRPRRSRRLIQTAS